MSEIDGIPHQRCWDLLRQMRGHLSDEKLISMREYGWLVAETPGASGGGSPAPRRLESYDEMKDRLHEADAVREQRDAALAVLKEIEAHARSFRDGQLLFGTFIHPSQSFSNVILKLAADFLAAQETTK